MGINRIDLDEKSKFNTNSKLGAANYDTVPVLLIDSEKFEVFNPQQD